MFLEIDGLNVFYERNTGEGTPLLLLHGWGCDAYTMRRIFDCFSSRGRDVTAIDFPGFGRSDTPPPEFTVYDYAAVVKKLTNSLFETKPDVIAHSFGARIAIILASQNSINRLLIADGAGLKPRRGLKYRLKVGAYKLKRKLLKREPKNAGSDDYRALKPEMKRIFVSVVNTHLDGLLPEISCQTLLVWGKRDKDTPLYMAKRILRRVRESGLIVFENAGHFCFLDDPIRFELIALEFFSEVDL